MLEQPIPTIFLAHSSLDKAAARVVRNMFEELEHEALLLHLEQDMTDDYLHELIRKEIQARDWMIIVSSENARQSRWVPLEEAYARFYRKPIYYVNIENCLEGTEQALRDCLHSCILSISQNIRVFLSYSQKDKPMAIAVTEELRTSGYQVWLDTALMPGMNWQHQIQQVIDETLERGCIVTLVSANSAESREVESELRFAIAHNQPRIIPCIIEPSPQEILPALNELQYVDLRTSEGHQRLREALQRIRTSFCE